MGCMLSRRESISSTICSANCSPPSAEGGEGWRRSRHKMVFRLCGGEAGAFRSPPPPLRGSHLLTGIAPKRWQVAAALSAAVTITPKQGTASNSHGRTSWKEKTSLFPAALREGARGRGFSQRSRLPRSTAQPRQAAAALCSRRDHNPKTRNRTQLAWAHKPGGKDKLIPSCSSGGSAREGFSQRSRLPRIPCTFPIYLFGRGPRGGASL